MPLDYPIKFTPILQERIWGGDKLHKLFNKAKLDVPVGESWEISAIPGNISVVKNGSLAGKNLQDLIEKFKADFVGENIYARFGNKFPLLLKFIDARSDLSVQLHPNDSQALKRHNSLGKEEMWYIMQTEKEGRLLFGFNQKISKECYLKHLKNKTLPSLLHSESIREGDVFHIPPGRVHAIGKGVVLAEIQQSSDITYRLYDWDRKDTNGKARELHSDLALNAINFNVPNRFSINYKTTINRYTSLVHTPSFKTNLIELDKVLEVIKTDKDCFTIYMCVAGFGSVNSKNTKVSIKTGETIMIPAVLNNYLIKPVSKTIRLLQISV